MSDILKDAERVVGKFAVMRQSGAVAVQAAVTGGQEVGREVATFAEGYPEWMADGGLEETGHISYYPKTGMAYLCGNAIQREEHFAPDIATNNYNPYPQPDAEGVYPYVYGMTVWSDMLVRGGDGSVYRCILPAGTYKLVYEPKDATGVFVPE